MEIAVKHKGRGHWGALPVRRTRHPLAFASMLAVCAIVLLPILALALIALTGTGEDWPHLVSNVLPRATITTAALIAIVSIGTAVIGVATAWLVVGYDFPLRRLMSWLLVLPLAVPPYLAAYAFGEFFLFTGPVQTLYRAIFGFRTPQDYWFPDLRSTPGAAFTLICVLYPYVYLTSRAVFLMQGRNIADAARTLGAPPFRVFRRVLLPVARPAIAAGVFLVLMETINDIGVAEYLGVRTFTATIYTTWINRGSLEGAAQLSMLMLILVVLLLFGEQAARRKQRFHNVRATQVKARRPRTKLTGWRAGVALSTASVPVLLGFCIPLWVFGRYAWRRLEYLLDAGLAKAFLNSLLAASLTAFLAVCLALFMIYAVRLSRSGPTRLVARLAFTGYALPGTILGLGLLFALARFDNSIDAFARAHLGFSTGLLLTGSAAAVVLACTIRFLALAESAIRAGLEKLPPSLDQAARSLGHSPWRSATLILAPLLRPAILTAFVLVFVDTVKELSATILLRPFGFNTLATLVYENASRAKVEDGAVAALLIIATATVPVILLSRALAQDQEASL
ncbi:iron ABC transporter permease [Pseudaminobacter sp. 19-2017]|uniref:Iron ABC transporter permease n=2 Tax=Pseudaminobacter soli (ex Zhang et al. 2022) TaxID=2831468 RepID=A0A942DX06_9HYPH|nr:iron ABC transporter permease [Pseudaminobacter soli]